MEKIIRASAPLRLSLAGGGTDLPEYYLKKGANLLSVTLDRRIAIEAGHNIKHSPSVLTDFFQKRNPGYHVTIGPSIGAGAGLGGSGAIAAALVAMEHYIKFGKYDPLEVGKEAYRWERMELNQPVGFQDQIASAVGGCVEMIAYENGEIYARRRHDLELGLKRFFEDNFIIVETGIRREANYLLKKLTTTYKTTDHNLPADFKDVEKSILENDINQFGNILRKHWESKKKRLPESSTEEIDQLIERMYELGANGAKTIGAGGGGFILLTVIKNHKKKLLEELHQKGYEVMNVSLSTRAVEVNQDEFLSKI